MLISREWLSDFVTIDPAIDDRRLAHDLTLHTVEVEGYDRPTGGLADAVIGLVRDLDRHAGGTTLRLDLVDGEVEVTTDLAVPDTVGGVIVSVRPDGVVLVDPAAVALEALLPGAPLLDRRDCPTEPGIGLARWTAWDDTIFEIDNKSLTNRPDLWGHLGIAREIAAIYDLDLREPATDGPFASDETAALIGEVDPTACNRFTLARIDASGLDLGSPLRIRSRLLRVGQRPINLWADLTNYVMFAVGQPCHAYDAGAVSLPLSVGRSPGASLQVIGGRSIELTEKAPVIADADGPVGLAGIIGGAETGVTEDSTDIVWEMGNFDARAVRSTALAYDLRTDASSRFDKALDTQSIDRGWTALAALLDELGFPAAGRTRSDVAPRPTEPTQVVTTTHFLNARMGTGLSGDEIARRLRRLGFVVDADGAHLTIDVPTWRSTGDVSLPNDILEEVARLIGYDALPPAAPTIALRKPKIPPLLAAQRRVREFLAANVGAQEVLTYPWTSERLLRALRMDDLEVVRIETSAPDGSRLRPSLLPNLLGAVEVNLATTGEMALFEVGTTYHPTPDDGPPSPGEERLPELCQRVGLVLVGRSQLEVYQRAVGAVTGLARAARVQGLTLAEDPDTRGWGDPVARRAIVGPDGVTRGRVAAFDLSVAKTPASGAVAAMVELALDDLVFLESRTNHYRPVSQYPDATIDVSVDVPDGVSWDDIVMAVQGVVHVADVAFGDEYRGASVPAGWRSVRLQARLQSDERTLTSADKHEARSAIVSRLVTSVGAVDRAQGHVGHQS